LVLLLPQRNAVEAVGIGQAVSLANGKKGMSSSFNWQAGTSACYSQPHALVVPKQCIKPAPPACIARTATACRCVPPSAARMSAAEAVARRKWAINRTYHCKTGQLLCTNGRQFNPWPSTHLAASLAVQHSSVGCQRSH
jgi:hypothetical protein